MEKKPSDRATLFPCLPDVAAELHGYHTLFAITLHHYFITERPSFLICQVIMHYRDPAALFSRDGTHARDIDNRRDRFLDPGETGLRGFVRSGDAESSEKEDLISYLETVVTLS